eukprot:gene8993-18613_t
MANGQVKATVAVIVVSCILCFIPIIANIRINTNKYDDLDLVPLRRTLLAPSFKYSTLAAIAATFPVLLDFIIDLSYRSTRQIYPVKAAVWILLLSSIISNSVTFFYVMPNFHFEFLIAFSSARTSQVQTTDDVCCTLNMYALIAVASGLGIIQIVLGDHTSIDAGPLLYTWRLVFSTVYTVVTTGLNGRYIRQKILIDQTINAAVSGDTLVKLVDELNGSGDVAVDILNDLLVYERLDQGSISISTKSLFIKHYLRSKHHYFTQIARKSGISLELNLPASFHLYDMTEAYIMVDEEKFSQVIRNLVLNAIECTPKDNTITMNVSIINRHLKDSSSPFYNSIGLPVLNNSGLYFIRIDIKDAGYGLSKENQEEIFKNAFSFSAGVLQSHQGKGLGLWISNRIMELHKGGLSVYSDGVGHGCTFTLHLPVYFSTESGRTSASQRSPTSSGFTDSTKLIRNFSTVVSSVTAGTGRSRKSRSVLPNPITSGNGGGNGMIASRSTLHLIRSRLLSSFSSRSRAGMGGGGGGMGSSEDVEVEAEGKSNGLLKSAACALLASSSTSTSSLLQYEVKK